VLDELDKKIIRILQRNARVPNTEIGRASTSPRPPSATGSAG
jgi:DNA-binding Lrp family transcriptional regulator